MSPMVASLAWASGISSRKDLYFTRKSWAWAESDDPPLSFAIIFQVAKSARARVSARLASILSGALITFLEPFLRCMTPWPSHYRSVAESTLPQGPSLRVSPRKGYRDLGQTEFQPLEQ